MVNPGRLAIVRVNNVTTAGTNVVSKAWLWLGGAGTPDLCELVLATYQAYCNSRNNRGRWIVKLFASDLGRSWSSGSQDPHAIEDGQSMTTAQ